MSTASADGRPPSSSPSLPSAMQAVVIDGYGGPERLELRTVAVPTPAAGEVLIQVAAAGVGVWDVKQREGAMRSMEPNGGLPFPVVLGADGAGVIAALGDGVVDFAIGDAVYGIAFLSPKGGFYAHYVAVPAEQVARIPAGMDRIQAGALGVTAVTALRGLQDRLHVGPGDRVLVFGASGGLGLTAVQLARAMGASVLGVVTSEDGAEAAREAGAERVVDMKLDDLPLALREFAPDGLDAVLATAAGDGLAQGIAALRAGGRLAWPHGVYPEPESGPDVVASAFDGRPDRALFDRLGALIESRPFQVRLAATMPFAEAAAAHRAMESHHLGRMVLTVR